MWYKDLMRSVPSRPFLVVMAVVFAVGVAAAQEQTPPSPSAAPSPLRSVYERYTQPIELYKGGLGTFTKPISSKVPGAQAFFDQGFQMMYAFAKPEAVRSFREAWTRDADCAICYWGEAWAWGSYLNAPMTAEESPYAFAAAQKAISLRDRATPKERALIDALGVRYVKEFDVAKRVDQDRAYANAMQKVRDQYPDDLEVATLYADALFLLEPRRGTRDVNDPNVHRLHQELERILSRDVRHPGACHLYVHATESTVVPGKAEQCAEFLGRSIPGASHINHMPSHTWNEIGRWGDSVRANLEAWHSDQKAAIGQGFAIYPEHNLHMLLYAASYDGQGAVAMRAGKDYAKLTGDSFYEVLTLMRFGRFDEVLQVTNRPKSDVSGGLWDFTQGYAHLKQGNTDFAQLYLGRVKKAADTSKGGFRFHTAKDLLSIAVGILEGEIQRTAGDLTGAIASFTRAARQHESLIYDEPEPLPFAPHHWLGAALIEAKRYEEAEQEYRKELKDHPKNGWSLLGIKQAREARGLSTADVDAELAAAWARADTWIRASRF
jgi:tetratricopeptide (TPR) repeat protein